MHRRRALDITESPLATLDGLTPCHVHRSITTHLGHTTLRPELTPHAVTPDGPNFALIDGIRFLDETIQVNFKGSPASIIRRIQKYNDALDGLGVVDLMVANSGRNPERNEPQAGPLRERGESSTPRDKTS
jgi:hypothetical protein